MDFLINENPIKQVFRIKQINFTNFRNIGHGSIKFQNSDYYDIQEGLPSILGLYGQNGSGKTSVIMALAVLKRLLSGESIEDGYASCIRQGFERCSLSFMFGGYTYSNQESIDEQAIFPQSEIVYSFDLTKKCTYELSEDKNNAHDKILFVENEVIQIRQFSPDGAIIIPKQVIIDTSIKSNNSGYAFGNSAKYLKYVGDSDDDKAKLLKIKNEMYSSGKSFIFCKKILKYVEDKKAEMAAKRVIDATEKLVHFCTLFGGDMDDIYRSLQSNLKILKPVTDKDTIIDTSRAINIENPTADDALYIINFISSMISELDDIVVSVYPNHKKSVLAKEYSLEDLNDGDNDESGYDITEVLLKDYLKRYELVMRDVMQKNLLRDTIASLMNYGMHCLHIVDTTITGQTIINASLPLLLWGYDKPKVANIEQYNNMQIGYATPFSECINLNMDDKTSVEAEKFEIISNSIQAINTVLTELLPEIKLGFKDLGIAADSDGNDMHYFEMQSIRKETIIPLKYESDGVRRIISLTSLFIAVYNEPSFTMAIDEIDSGIFEYLLGELFHVLAESAQGQFIFTSHNLRPLEVLPAKYLCFTSVNPDNRFVYLRNRGNSNLRDTYFRTIILGTDSEAVYQPTDRYRIQRAFYKAGHAGTL